MYIHIIYRYTYINVFLWDNSLFLWPFSIAILTQPEGNELFHSIPGVSISAPNHIEPLRQESLSIYLKRSAFCVHYLKRSASI